MAPRSDANVLTTFNDNGWSSVGLACLVGISAPVVSTIGAVSSPGRLTYWLHRSRYFALVVVGADSVIFTGLAMPLS